MDLDTFSIFDTIFFIALLIAAISGYIKGFVRQLIGLTGIIAGTYFAYKLASVSTNWWHGSFDERAVRIIVFSVLAILFYFLAFWLAKMLDKLLKMAMLSWINRLLGLVFGMLKIIIIFSALSFAIHFLKLTGIEILKSDIGKSKIYTHLIYTANMVFPYIK